MLASFTLSRLLVTAVAAMGLILSSCSVGEITDGERQASNTVSSPNGPPKNDGLLKAIASNGSGPIFERPNRYDYGASIIQEDGVRKFWWCGYEPYLTDSIFYATQNLSDGQFSAVQRVFEPTGPTSGQWDGQFTCDPSVVRGQFFNPDDAQTYTYAMYYTATDELESNNRIGVAWSNDGINWIRYSGNPIVYPQTSPTGFYGAGQAAVFNANGAAGLFMVYTDFTPHPDGAIPNDGFKGERGLFMRTTQDGIHFSPPTQVSTAGVLPGQPVRIGNADIAYNAAEGNWYAVFAPGIYDDDYLPITPMGTRLGLDRERYTFGLYRMAGSQFPSGTWEHLGYVDTNSTLFEINHNPAIVRGPFGGLDVTAPNVDIVFSGGLGNEPHSWELYSARWSDLNPRAMLKRYHSPYAGAHRVTTGPVPSHYGFEQDLGYLLRGRRAAGVVPLYGCRRTSTDYFVSLDGGCEGTYPLGVNGFIYASPPSEPHQAIYRCWTGTSHFVSLAYNCEGAMRSQNNEMLLGYTLLNPS